MFRITWMIIPLIACCAAFNTAGPAGAAERSIIEACTRTVNDVVWLLDHPGPDLQASAGLFASLFTGDASLTAPNDDLADETHTGAKALTAYYLNNRSDTRFLHITSNIRIWRISGQKAAGTHYVSFSMHAGTGSMKDAGAVRGVLENHDEYRVSGNGCQIAKRVSLLRWISLDGVIDKNTRW